MVQPDHEEPFVILFECAIVYTVLSLRERWSPENIAVSRRFPRLPVQHAVLCRVPVGIGRRGGIAVENG